MAKEAVFQLRMDAEMKEQVETLYQKMGTSFAEAVRMFAAQSLHEQGLPFKPSALGSRWAVGCLTEDKENICLENPALDQKLMDAIEMVIDDGHVSICMLQQRMQISYARAERLISSMEKLGVISAARAGKPREILMSRQQYEKWINEMGL